MLFIQNSPQPNLKYYRKHYQHIWLHQCYMTLVRLHAMSIKHSVILNKYIILRIKRQQCLGIEIETVQLFPPCPGFSFSSRGVSTWFHWTQTEQRSNKLGMSATCCRHSSAAKYTKWPIQHVRWLKYISDNCLIVDIFSEVYY